MEHFRIFETLDSTNKEAQRLLASGHGLHGIAILALQQTDGRGQYGRTWWAEPGSHLAMSVILQPDSMLPGLLPQLSMKTSLAVARCLLALDPKLKPLIKWPNDIYIGNQKIAGILIENSISSTKVQHCVIGIGLNVNEKKFPPNLPNPVSLKMLTGSEFQIPSLASQLREELMKVLDETPQNWKPEYDQLIYGLGTTQDFDLNGTMIKREIIGVDLDGKIILDTGQHQRSSYFSHEIKWLK